MRGQNFVLTLTKFGLAQVHADLLTSSGPIIPRAFSVRRRMALVRKSPDTSSGFSDSRDGGLSRNPYAIPFQALANSSCAAYALTPGSLEQPCKLRRRSNGLSHGSLDIAG